MEQIGLKDLFYIGGIILSAVITFISTRHKLKEHIRDKFDESMKSIVDLKLEIEKLKSKDELQQQIIDQFKNQVLDHLPKLFQLVDDKEYAKRK